MKTTFNKSSISRAALVTVMVIYSLAATADTVLFSFNNEIVAVESNGSVYNIPLNAFRSHFGEPSHFKRVELSSEFTKYRVYESNSADDKQSLDQEQRLIAKYFNYGGVYYKQYGDAYARLITEKNGETPLYSWTTLADNKSVTDRAPASVSEKNPIGFLTISNNTTISGRLLPTESEEVFVIDDGGALYWVKKSDESIKQTSFSESQILWKASYK